MLDHLTLAIETHWTAKRNSSHDADNEHSSNDHAHKVEPWGLLREWTSPSCTGALHGAPPMLFQLVTNRLDLQSGTARQSSVKNRPPRTLNAPPRPPRTKNTLRDPPYIPAIVSSSNLGTAVAGKFDRPIRCPTTARISLKTFEVSAWTAWKEQSGATSSLDSHLTSGSWDFDLAYQIRTKLVRDTHLGSRCLKGPWFIG